MKNTLALVLFFFVFNYKLALAEEALCPYLDRELTCQEINMSWPLYDSYLASFRLLFNNPEFPQSEDRFRREANILLNFVNHSNQCSSN